MIFILKQQQSVTQLTFSLETFMANYDTRPFNAQYVSQRSPKRTRAWVRVATPLGQF